jgi:ABC-type transport system involved in cytochrome c biogenesis ATPase subunit
MPQQRWMHSRGRTLFPASRSRSAGAGLLVQGECAGKTSLLASSSGCRPRPRRGRWDGRPIRSLGGYRRESLVRAANGLKDDLSALENVRAAAA